jgi:CheY-like chemotaxis protein
MSEIAGVAAARIIIVEDEGLIAYSLELVLKKAGYHVIATVASSEEVLPKVKELSPHLLLMDIHIRGSMDGIDTTAKMRETSDIPVIYLSGQADPHTLERASRTSTFGILKKPFNEGLLLTSIEKALQQQPPSGSARG